MPVDLGPPVTVTLPADVWGLACDVGDGSAAAGIELALRRMCAGPGRDYPRALESERDAMFILREMLKDGPAPVKAIKAEALGAGIPIATLLRCKRKHKVVVLRRGGFAGAGAWYWDWPKVAEKAVL